MVCHINIGLKQFITAKLKTNNKSFMDRKENFAYRYRAGPVLMGEPFKSTKNLCRVC